MDCTYIEVLRPLKVLDTTDLNSPIHTQSYTHGGAATQAANPPIRSKSEVKYLAQRHVDMWTGRAGNWCSSE